MSTLPTDYQQFVAISRYARYLDKEGRRETWAETVKRYFDFMQEHLKENQNYDLSAELRGELESAVLNLEVMPSMRALMTAGPALKRDTTCAYNCSYLPINSPRSFDELFYILLCGTGVGYSTERQYINELPTVSEHFEKSNTTIVVEDSKAGWARAFKELVAMLYAGQIPTWDVSKIRPAGARLRTFGGRASGPGPLTDLFNYTVGLFKGAAGRKLNSLECHDLCCKIASVVVVGGVRRSAMISLSNLSDQRMRDAKSGSWYVTHPDRAFANNSVAYTEKPDMATFINEWASLYNSKSGERGIFFRNAAKEQAAKNGRREGDEFGTNPCITGDSRILTEWGYEPIKKLVGKKLNMWNGKEFSEVTPFSTGQNHIVCVTLSNGAKIKCTPYHKFVVVDGKNIEARNLIQGQKLEKFSMPVINHGQNYSIDPYSQGFYSGDGNGGYEFSFLYPPKYVCESRLCGTVSEEGGKQPRKTWKHGKMLPKSFVPVDGTKDFCMQWLAGVMDSDGTVTSDKNGQGLQIVSIDFDFLENIRLMLSRLGVSAKIVSASPAAMRPMPDGKGGRKDYNCKQTKRLLVGNYDTHKLIQNGFNPTRLELHGNPPQRDARRFVTVVSVEDTGNIEETFCVTEPKNGTMTVEGVVTGNCGEIILKPFQFCNLTEVVVRAADDLSSLKNKVRLASILGTFQSTLTHFKYLRKVWRDNTESERLLGVSLTGCMDNKVLSGKGDCGDPDLSTVLSVLKEQAIDVNKHYAGLLGIPVSVAVTTQKPSGTVSQLVNSASGFHARYAKYYIRRVRGDIKDPLTQFMKDQGVPCEPCNYKPESTVVFSFPVKSDDRTTVFRDTYSAVQQLELWLKYKTYWTEHNVSATIQVKEHEWMEVGAWVYKHFDQITGVSFLPYDSGSYTQAPYEEITKEQYEVLDKSMPKNISWEKLAEYEKEDSTVSSQTYACTGEICEVVDIGSK